jgi:DNA-binding CsgD family transcriptional regulator
MYQVVNPAFAHFELLQSYYWALPYIIALLVLRNLSDKINKAYILYLSLIMIGLSFISFIWLDRSISSYLIINTLLLGAFGVADLFWWSILGNMLDYTDSPSQVFGIGLSMNVLGIFIGGTIGKLFISADIIHLQTSVIALVVLFMAMIMLPVLNTQLTWLLKKHQFLFHFASIPEIDQDKALDDFKENKQLTGKEAEVVRLLLRGYTYKAIAEQLLISENTMKFHVKNIYQKLGINSKMDLIKMFSE